MIEAVQIEKNNTPCDEQLMKNARGWGQIKTLNYNRAVQGVTKLAEGMQLLRQESNEEILDFSGPDGAINFLHDTLLPKEKSRIVIDYDPAADMVRIYIMSPGYQLQTRQHTEQEAQP